MVYIYVFIDPIEKWHQKEIPFLNNKAILSFLLFYRIALVILSPFQTASNLFSECVISSSAFLSRFYKGFSFLSSVQVINVRPETSHDQVSYGQFAPQHRWTGNERCFDTNKLYPVEIAWVQRLLKVNTLSLLFFRILFPSGISILVVFLWRASFKAMGYSDLDGFYTSLACSLYPFSNFGA